jgi:exonuclease V gamma subunit
LRALIALYEQGRRTPLPFFARTSWDYAAARAKAEMKAGAPLPAVDMGVFEKSARNAEGDNGFGGHNEFENEAVCIAWRGRELPGAADGALAQELHRIALAVFAEPARAWVEQFE